MKKILFIWLAILLSCSYAFAGGVIWSGGNMTYPGAGVAYTADGLSWGTSYATDGSGDCAAGAICLGNHTHSGYLSSVASDSDWTVHASYPTACGAGDYVTAIGDTLTCSTPAGGGDITAVGSCPSGACGVEGGTDIFPFIYEGTANTYETTLSVTDPTADNSIVLPDKSGTVAMTSDITGTNSGTNTGDSSGHSGLVTTDQTTPQTIGATGTRLAYIWATDGTFTNLPSIPLANGYILQGNGSGVAAAVNSLNIATIDMSAQTSSIPWTATTSAGAQTADGQAHWETDTDILSIGDGAGRISLDFTAQQTYTFPTTSATLARTDAANTFTGVQTMTSPVLITPDIGVATGTSLALTGNLSGLIPPIDGGAADLSLSSAQVAGTTVRNTGQGPNNRNHTLPAAAAGMSFLGVVGEAQAASYFRFTASTTPTPDDFMCLDGTCDKLYISIAAPTRGAQVACHTEQIASTGIKTGAAVAIGVTTKTLTSSGAFTFDIAGTGYAVGATADGTAMAAATTAQNRYGAEFLEVGVDGTIHAVAGTTVAAGFATEAEAIAEIVAQAPTAAHTKIGYVTALQTGVAGFVWGTDTLNGAGVTAAFYSTAVYTKPYNWICNKSVGTWVTN